MEADWAGFRAEGSEVHERQPAGAKGPVPLYPPNGNVAVVSVRVRRRWWRRAVDMALLPFALVLVLIEDVLWAGAKALLHDLNQLRFMRRLRVVIGRLPVAFALPLFLIPDIISHLFEIYAAVLLAQGFVRAAIAVEVFGKGVATLIVVWIYQACAPTLLKVRWFARVHHAVLAVRYWTLSHIAPVYSLVADYLPRPQPGGIGSLVQRRFRALCRSLSAVLAWRPSHDH